MAAQRGSKPIPLTHTREITRKDGVRPVTLYKAGGPAKLKPKKAKK